MQVNQIINRIQTADSLFQMNRILKQATIFQYIQERLEVQYDYTLNEQSPIECLDGDNNPVDLVDVKDAVIAIIAG